MTSGWRALGRTAAGLLLAATVSVPVVAQPTQPIYLQYDGYVRNKDGTFTLSFGYFNMNNVEVTVQPGNANAFTPAAGDRNQPVTFLKGRHRFACSMVVDGNFDGKLQWTLTFAGKTQTTTAKGLDPLYELELHSEKRATRGLDLAAAPKNVCVNRGPVVQVLAGPFAEANLEGATVNLAARVDQDLSVNGRVEDDGLPRGSHVTVAWKKISGPGNATFSNAATGPTTIKFSAPGAYALELSATDGEKSGTVRVNVAVK